MTTTRITVSRAIASFLDEWVKADSKPFFLYRNSFIVHGWINDLVRKWGQLFHSTRALVYINIKIIHYSIWHKLLLNCDKNNYIWSRRLKDTSTNIHWPSSFGPHGICVFSCYIHLYLQCESKKVAPLKLFAIFLLLVNLRKWKLLRLLPKHIPSFTPILIHLSEYLYELHHFY